ncbi:Very-long-chain 3-oxoacyl-coa reductase [Globisporangium polare]
MAQSDAKSLGSVLLHPTLLAFSAAVAVAALAPTELVARVVRNALLAYVVLLLLDIAVTKYHLGESKPTTPQRGRFALITGASSGIGREMAFQLAEKKYSLLIAARNEDALARVRKEIEALHAPHMQVEICACDLSTSDGIQKLTRFVADKKLVIDILINNAGASRTSEFLSLSDSQVDELLTLNVLAMTKLSHAIVPQMVARGVGRVLNVASMSAAISIPTAALYGSSKSFILSLSQAMSYELRGSGVTVTCTCPGPVHTNFGNAAQCDASIYMNTPGLALDSKECARRSLAAMFSAETDFYDSFVSRWGAALFRTLLPTRLGLLLAAVTMNEPRKLLQMIQRQGGR